MSNFPTALDSLSNPSAWDSQLTTSHSSQHTDLNNIVEALEAKVWVNWSAVTTSLDYKTTRLTAKGDILTHDWTNPIKKAVGTNGYMLVADSAQATGLNWIAATSGWTVTSVSVTPANWLTWSVANPTTTPALTLGTTITGVLKGNGTAISAASAWTDYYAPWSTDVAVADGGTGVSTLTSYAPIFWGTTWTWAVQSGTVGTSGQVLTSNWAWALPTFQNRIFTWVKCTTSAAQTIYDNSLDLLNFNSEEFDTDTFHNTSSNNWRITIPSGKAGKYQIMWQYRSATSAVASNNNWFALMIFKNWASTWLAMQKNGQIVSWLCEAWLQVTWILDLSVGDYIELYVSQRNVGSNTTTTAAWQFFSAYKLD